MEEMIYGYVPSILDGTETVLEDDSNGTLAMPKSYSYLRYMPEVLNQGSDSTCVPHSFSAVYDYYNAMKHPEPYEANKFDHVELSIDQVYRARKNAGEGMSLKEDL